MKNELATVCSQIIEHIDHMIQTGAVNVHKKRAKQPKTPVAIEAAGKIAEIKGLAAASNLEEVRTAIGDCKRCRLCKGRNKIVFGVGNPSARLMFIGEGPGADEDEQGEPFVGRAGQLLTKIIIAMGLTRDDVYIGNIVKCRPPDNRNPEPDEMSTCMPYLLKQIELIKPEIIVCLGAIASKSLLATEVPISKIRGKLIDWPAESLSAQLGEHTKSLKTCKLMPTFHPAFLLRNPPMKKFVWEDMQEVLKFLGLPVPKSA